MLSWIELINAYIYFIDIISANIESCYCVPNDAGELRCKNNKQQKIRTNRQHTSNNNNKNIRFYEPKNKRAEFGVAENEIIAAKACAKFRIKMTLF